MTIEIKNMLDHSINVECEPLEPGESRIYNKLTRELKSLIINGYIKLIDKRL